MVPQQQWRALAAPAVPSASSDDVGGELRWCIVPWYFPGEEQFVWYIQGHTQAEDPQEPRLCSLDPVNAGLNGLTPQFPQFLPPPQARWQRSNSADRGAQRLRAQATDNNPPPVGHPQIAPI
ncbi:hypothetical protein NDU88_001357 [Pleurodeles waltl]|uniref:Uncharacterized protein n=1 Tax=Pleurodeles waltl TaxID=8319 RepID=A0AAV7VA21_PLEWA|nr:hypothetical protein NDU88_001357 [Pleurodeles waltl]